jgi:RNA polymerase sigma factor (TIGR02999 family)
MTDPTPASAAPTGGEVTRLLHGAGGGDRDAYDRLFSVAYEELHRVAERQLRAAAPVSAAELVSEAYLRLQGQLGIDWQGRAHFYAIAAHAMRHILVDLARRQRAAKRGGLAVHTTLTGKDVSEGASPDTVLAVDDLLGRLEERQRRVVECRFFAGLSEEETAEALGVSVRTVRRDWVKARAWLYDAMYAEPS